MLSSSEIHANIPASDLDRARAFYQDKLGLVPTDENRQYKVLTYTTPSGSWFQVYETTFAGTAGHTIAQWDVDDISKTVTDLKSRGVEFEQYDFPGIQWENNIASGPMGRTAWFKDSEGNILCLDERAATA
jgi:predicted enzyme related to lactoylglutathione lyase